jgi:arabinose-5-phosphate isomerase
LNLVKNIKKIARDVLINESTAIQNLAQYIDDNFDACLQDIYSAKGRVVIMGIGKNAIIANKIVATLNVTRTPALFMLAAYAILRRSGHNSTRRYCHCVSKSGNTQEIKVRVPHSNGKVQNLLLW